MLDKMHLLLECQLIRLICHSIISSGNTRCPNNLSTYIVPPATKHVNVFHGRYPSGGHTSSLNQSPYPDLF